MQTSVHSSSATALPSSHSSPGSIAPSPQKGAGPVVVESSAPVVVDGKTRGLYVSGWSWSSYAYRLETAARGQAKSEVMNAGSKKEPLLYVYVVVDDAAYGAPVSPEVNAKAILAEKPLEHAQGDAVFAKTVDITGRDFGLAVKRVPALGKDVAIAVLRSET